jgi:hypothetical protein
MKFENINELLTKRINCPSKWELDNIIWADRTTNSAVLYNFLKRINELNSLELRTVDQHTELERLLELLSDMDEKECENLLVQTDEESKEIFIENLARTSAIEVLTNNKISFDTMTTACKLSPNDFILCAKRTQDIVNSVHELVIKGESLSSEVAGA